MFCNIFLTFTRDVQVTKIKLQSQMSKEIKMNVFDLLQSELYYKHVLVIQVFTV